MDKNAGSDVNIKKPKKKKNKKKKENDDEVALRAAERDAKAEAVRRRAAEREAQVHETQMTTAAEARTAAESLSHSERPAETVAQRQKKRQAMMRRAAEHEPVKRYLNTRLDYYAEMLSRTPSCYQKVSWPKIARVWKQSLEQHPEVIEASIAGTNMTIDAWLSTLFRDTLTSKLLPPIEINAGEYQDLKKLFQQMHAEFHGATSAHGPGVSIQGFAKANFTYVPWFVSLGAEVITTVELRKGDPVLIQKAHGSNGHQHEPHIIAQDPPRLYQWVHVRNRRTDEFGWVQQQLGMPEDAAIQAAAIHEHVGGGGAAGAAPAGLSSGRSAPAARPELADVELPSALEQSTSAGASSKDKEPSACFYPLVHPNSTDRLRDPPKWPQNIPEDKRLRKQILQKWTQAKLSQDKKLEQFRRESLKRWESDWKSRVVPGTLPTDAEQYLSTLGKFHLHCDTLNVLLHFLWTIAVEVRRSGEEKNVNEFELTHRLYGAPTAKLWVPARGAYNIWQEARNDVLDHNCEIYEKEGQAEPQQATAFSEGAAADDPLMIWEADSTPLSAEERLRVVHILQKLETCGALERFAELELQARWVRQEEASLFHAFAEDLKVFENLQRMFLDCYISGGPNPLGSDFDPQKNKNINAKGRRGKPRAVSSVSRNAAGERLYRYLDRKADVIFRKQMAVLAGTSLEKEMLDCACTWICAEKKDTDVLVYLCNMLDLEMEVGF
eukprot:g13647.t1